MKDLMIMLSSVMPDDFIYENLKEEITSYQLSQTKEAKDKIEMLCMIVLSKRAAEEAGGAEELIKKTDIHEKAMGLLIPNPANKLDH